VIGWLETAGVHSLNEVKHDALISFLTQALQLKEVFHTSCGDGIWEPGNTIFNQSAVFYFYITGLIVGIEKL
jgi:hypothetical protein